MVEGGRHDIPVQPARIPGRRERRRHADELPGRSRRPEQRTPAQRQRLTDHELMYWPPQPGRCPPATATATLTPNGNTVGITGSNGSHLNQQLHTVLCETTALSSALPNMFTFGGQVGVMQIGQNLFDMRARVYSSGTGQFLSNDPVGLAGGDANERRYAFNNPAARSTHLAWQQARLPP